MQQRFHSKIAISHGYLLQHSQITANVGNHASDILKLLTRRNLTTVVGLVPNISIIQLFVFVTLTFVIMTAHSHNFNVDVQNLVLYCDRVFQCSKFSALS